ncbi:MAG: hypothetical protein ACKV2V_16320 [Blastocatellia bacterium]
MSPRKFPGKFTRQARARLAMLVLLALFNVSLHVYCHWDEVFTHNHATVMTADGHESTPFSRPSLNNINSCSACLALSEFQADALPDTGTVPAPAAIAIPAGPPVLHAPPVSIRLTGRAPPAL